jgi:hypothetical protein
VATLVVTGIVQTLAVAGGVYQLASSRYGLVLLIKIAIFGLMLLMGNEGRKYAARAAFRQSHLQPDGPVRAGGISTLAVVMGAELCISGVRRARMNQEIAHEIPKRSQSAPACEGRAMVDTCAAFDAAGRPRLRQSSSLEGRARRSPGIPAPQVTRRLPCAGSPRRP